MDPDSPGTHAPPYDPQMLIETLGAARDMGRLNAILGVLIRHGFGDSVRRLGLADRLERAGHALKWEHAADLARLEPPVQLRLTLEELGPTFVKFGQILAGRADLLGPEYIAEFEKLHSHVPAVPLEQLRPQLREDLGGEPEAVFARFDVEPLAAASIAQVHRAQLHDGSEVVVKIRRPGISDTIAADLRLLARLAALAEAELPALKPYRPRQLVRELARSLQRELDLASECRSAERIAINLAAMPWIVVPKVHWAHTQERVNVQDYVGGVAGHDLARLDAHGLDRGLLARRGAQAVLKMIVEDGFFHADPHPGNLFVTPLAGNDAEGHRNWQLTFVDFGMVGRVPENLRSGLREAVIAVGLQDGARLVKAFKTLGVLLPSADLKLIEMASIQVFERFGGMSMGELRDIDHDEMMRFGLQFRELMLNLPFQLPENLLLLGRSIAVLSGMCTGLDPEFNLWGSIAPYATKLVSDEGGSTWGTILAEGTKIFQTVIGLPARTDRVLTMIERGELNVQTPMLELRVRRLERSVGTISGGLVFSALLVAGAILYGTDAGLGTGLMGASALPLVWILMRGRGRHMGRG